jgi:hypothetical protein
MKGMLVIKEISYNIKKKIDIGIKIRCKGAETLIKGKERSVSTDKNMILSKLLNKNNQMTS